MFFFLFNHEIIGGNISLFLEFVIIFIKKKGVHNITCRTPLAESEGFKPPIPERGIPDFESSAIVHSANSPSRYFRCKGSSNI